MDNYLPDTAPSTMQERQQCEIALSTTMIIWLTRRSVDPSLRYELSGVGSPELRGAVEPPDGHYEVCSFRDFEWAEFGIADGDAPGVRDGRI